MRDIAEASELSLGAAYHYFSSKEALVQAYYEWIQGEHERLERAAAAPDSDLKTKLRTLLETKLELLRRDRKVLAALFGSLGDPSQPLSLFGKETAAVRERSVDQFVAMVDDPSVPEEIRAPLGRALWLGHLGVFLFFIHDASANQSKTHELVDKFVDLVAMGVPLLAHPLAAPIRCQLLGLFEEIAPARRP